MRKLFLLLLLLACSTASAETRKPATRPVMDIKRVLIFSVDGMRPDLVLRADTPVMHGMMDSGTFTFWARTTEIAITLPSHVSMLTGMTPKKHKVDWNAAVPEGRYPYPVVPTLFEVARSNGYTAALATGKSKFDAFSREGALDWSYIPSLPATSTADVAKNVGEIMKSHRPEVMFVHFPSVDAAGHGKGWGSPEQLKAISGADAAIGQILAAAKEAGTLDETLVIVTADHGGQGKVHGPNDARSRHIPWICTGPGVRKGYDLGRIAELNVNTEDTFATACWVLGIPLEKNLDGKPVAAIFPAPTTRPGELLVDSPK